MSGMRDIAVQKVNQVLITFERESFLYVIIFILKEAIGRIQIYYSRYTVLVEKENHRKWFRQPIFKTGEVR